MKPPPSISAPAIAATVAVLAWQGASGLGAWDLSLVPSPLGIVLAAYRARIELIQDTGVTLMEVVAGFTITVSASLFVGTLLHLFPRAFRGAYGSLVALQVVPLWAISPVLFYWTGPGLLTRLIIIVLVAFFPVLATTLLGFARTDSGLGDLLVSMRASAWQRLVHLEIPNALSSVLTGSKITLTMCLIGAVLAEMTIGDFVGLGYRIKAASSYFRADLVFACAILLSAIGISLYGLLDLVERSFEQRSSSGRR